jgi:hypothetical protein
MNHPAWRSPRVSRVSFEVRGGSLQYAAIAVLVLVIVGALAIAFWPESGPGTGPVSVPDRTLYKCTAEGCDEAFYVEAAPEFRQRWQEAELTWALGRIVPVSCPTCEGPGEALPAVECPRCETIYVPVQVRRMVEHHRERPGEPMPDEVYQLVPICPECGEPYFRLDQPPKSNRPPGR